MKSYHDHRATVCWKRSQKCKAKMDMHYGTGSVYHEVMYEFWKKRYNFYYDLKKYHERLDRLK